ncbi:MAG: AMP-binding protein [Spirochaetales bacterium]|nr:AMP-binding protein [Spirochaetales bacterium]
MEKESLYYLVRDTVATFAERPCYWVKPDGQNFVGISYFNWRADMKRWSAFLIHKLGVAHGDRVGLLCDNRYEWNLLSLGITTIGAIDVPRGCDATTDDIRYILNHTRCQVLVIEHEKMLQTLIAVLPDLPDLKSIVCINSPEKFKKLEAHQGKLGKVKLHFLVDALAEGDELLTKHGEASLKKRGEAIKPSDLATIIYTSGTTGQPKGVMLEHRSFCWEVAQIQLTYPISEYDRVVVFLPPWHIAERLLETTLIACGGSMAPSGILTLSHDLETIKPTFLVSVPRVWEQLHKRIFDNVRKQPEKKQKIFSFAQNAASIYTDALDNLLDRFAETEVEAQGTRLARKVISFGVLILYLPVNLVAQVILSKVKNIFGGKLRFAISGAGALPEHVALFFRSVGIPILDAYGMTETTGVSAAASLPMPRRGCVGKPLQGVQLQIREEDGRIITRPGVKGVLWHKGPHIMRGYYLEPEKTAAVLRDGWLNSGDLFMWTLTGEVKFAGRAKDTIVLASGENIEPGPIEMKLAESEYVAQVVVVGQDRKTLGALIVPNVERVKQHFQEAGQSIPEDMANWPQDRSVHQFFAEIVKDKISSSNGFKAFEKVTGFALLPREFEKGKEMTETMKIKRNVVFDLYAREIDEIYAHEK